MSSTTHSLFPLSLSRKIQPSRLCYHARKRLSPPRRHLACRTNLACLPLPKGVLPSSSFEISCLLALSTKTLQAPPPPRRLSLPDGTTEHSLLSTCCSFPSSQHIVALCSKALNFLAVGGGQPAGASLCPCSRLSFPIVQQLGGDGREEKTFSLFRLMQASLTLPPVRKLQIPDPKCSPRLLANERKTPRRGTNGFSRKKRKQERKNHV